MPYIEAKGASAVTITQKMTQSGYQPSSRDYLFANEGVPMEQLRYQMEFTLSLQT